MENRNIRIEHRFASGDLSRMQAYAAELVSSAPDLIAASGSPVVAALKHASRTIPIVFSAVIDPVGQGFVASLSRPGGNITGFTLIDFPIMGKWLELLKEIAPGVRRMTFMFSPPTAPWVPLFLEKPADLPVQAPTKYELVINLKTAKALGLDIPATMLARADDVMQ